MNTSQFMDKQITALTASQGGEDILNLINPASQGDHNIHSRHSNGGDGLSNKDEILPSYDFQPIRAAPQASSLNLEASWPSWGSVDRKSTSSNARNYSSLDMDVVAEIDHAMKKHADILLNGLESVSSRLSQLETRTRHLESSVDDLKFAIGDNHGSTDGMLRQLENIMREVQTGVQVLRDKHEIMETQLQLSKMQIPSGEQRISGATQAEPQLPLPAHQPAPPPQPVQQTPHPPVVPQQLALPAPPAQLTPSVLPPQQNPPLPYPTQVPQPQMPPLPPEQSYALSQPQEPSHPYQSAIQQPPPGLPPPPLSSQPYQMSPQPPPQYPPPPQPSQHQPGYVPHAEESAPYSQAAQPYPPIVRPPTSGPPPPQFYGSAPSLYETPTSKPSPTPAPYSAGYGPPPGSTYKDPLPFGGFPSYPKPSQFPSSVPPSGGSSHPRLPTAQLLPQAVPTGPSSGGSTGNRVPIDDVVEKVALMGFSRDQVRATVRKLTENGQSVDLNVVLDKLMNGGDVQSQKTWYGR